MAEFRMPSLGADMEQGTLLRWMVHPGDVVHQGDIVAEVDTAKAAIEVECFDDGTVGEILVPEGVTVPVGTVLATIESVSAPANQAAPQAIGPEGVAEASPDVMARAESVSAPSQPESKRTQHRGKSTTAAKTGTSGMAPARASRRRKPTPAVNEAAPAPAGLAAPGADPHATPLIRRLAQEAGIDLATITGSGQSGRIVRADVERAIAARAAAAPRINEPTGGALAGTDHVRASGYARRLAGELGIELPTVRGSGPDGAIQAVDVRAAQPLSAARRTSVEPSAAVKMPGRLPVDGQLSSAAQQLPRDQSAMRRTIAAAMTRSKQTIPHYYLSSIIDVTAARDWLHEVNKAAPVPDRIIMAALLLRAVARAARAVPEVNGHWTDDAFHPAETVDLGVIVSLRGGGIIAPTLANADATPLRELMTQLREAVSRARSARLRSRDTIPATLTVTNLVELGVESVLGVIPPPQVAIVGFGAVIERPCAIGGLLGVRPQITATLAADHRASDGAVGARFLNTIAELLQHPDQL